MKMKKRWGMVLLAGLLCLPVQAGDWLYKGSRAAVVIDVRTAVEYAAGHVEGALNVPYDEIAGKIGAVPGASKEQPILLYCRSGRRSALAKEALEKLGYRRVLDGGGMTELARSLKACSARSC